MTSLDEDLAVLGITPVGSNTFSPFSLEDIKKIEMTINFELPEPYKAFLMKYGQSMFVIESDSAIVSKPVNYCCFFSLDELLSAIEYLKETLPESIIPIGDDSGDIVLCLGVSGVDAGRMYVHNNGWGWHADAEKYLENGQSVPSSIRYHTVEEVARSFSDFVSNMTKG